MRKRFCLVMLALLLSATARAQDTDTTAVRSASHKLFINWNEYDLGFTTVVLGAGFLTEYASYNQDSLSREQFHLVRQGRIRDSRLLASGKFNTSRPATWQTGFMYDWPTSKWLVRMTAITVGIPEISGSLQIGRMKEGLSLNKVMVGYDGWTAERFTFNDAAIPLLADGIKWMGYAPKVNLVWNLGAYTNWLSEGETWSYYQKQVVARVAYLKMDSASAGKLVHVGLGLHVGEPEKDTLRLKSRPEAFPAPTFIDTDKFHATLGTISGLEAFYRNGSWLFGTEYYLQWVKSQEAHDPFFHGGDIFASWLVTGESRPYETNGGFFRAVSPRRPVFKGGPGAWEVVLRMSYTDLNSNNLTGGEFWRITPVVNWHMNNQARFEFTYGFGVLDRFGVRGATEFFQVRLQLQFSKLGTSGD